MQALEAAWYRAVMATHQSGLLVAAAATASPAPGPSIAPTAPPPAAVRDAPCSTTLPACPNRVVGEALREVPNPSRNVESGDVPPDVIPMLTAVPCSSSTIAPAIPHPAPVVAAPCVSPPPLPSSVLSANAAPVLPTPSPQAPRKSPTGLPPILPSSYVCQPCPWPGCDAPNTVAAGSPRPPLDLKGWRTHVSYHTEFTHAPLLDSPSSSATAPLPTAAEVGRL